MLDIQLADLVPRRGLVGVQILERDDPSIQVEHIHRALDGWLWERTPNTRSWMVLWSEWPYLFTFSDGTHGVCRGAEIHRALREFGARVEDQPCE